METFEEHIIRISLPLPFRLNHVNSYVIREQSGWSVIDPGLNVPETERQWENTLRELALNKSALQRIIVTHFHPDHYGYAGTMQQWSKAAVYASPLTFGKAERYYSLNQMERYRRFYSRAGLPAELAEGALLLDRAVLKQIAPVQGERIFLRESEKVALGGQVYTVVTGNGHAEGSIGLWDKSQNVFIGGDLLLEKITPNISYDYESEANPLQDYLDTLDSLRYLDIVTVLPGHGTRFKLHEGYYDQLTAHHHERLASVHAMVSGTGTKGATLYEVCLQLFPKVNDAEGLRFALSETAAHLRVLETQKLLMVQELNGVLFFSAQVS